MEMNQNIGMRIRTMREARNMTRQNFIDCINTAENTMLDETMLRKIENGILIPKIDTIGKIVVELGFDVPDLNDDLALLAPLLSEDDCKYNSQKDFELVNSKLSEYRVLFPKERDEFLPESEKMTGIYKKMHDYPIMTLFEFMIYLPLMDIKNVYQTLGGINLEYCGLESCDYILSQLKQLYDDIPNSPEKRAADRIAIGVQYQTVLDWMIIKANDKGIIPSELQNELVPAKTVDALKELFGNPSGYIEYWETTQATVSAIDTVRNLASCTKALCSKSEAYNRYLKGMQSQKIQNSKG